MYLTSDDYFAHYLIQLQSRQSFFDCLFYDYYFCFQVVKSRLPCFQVVQKTKLAQLVLNFGWQVLARLERPSLRIVWPVIGDLCSC